MAETTLTVPGLAGRYATALFELARDARAIEPVADSLDRVARAIEVSPDLAGLLANPMVSRPQATAAMQALAGALQLDGLATRMLGVLATNRRLAVLPGVIRAFGQLVSAHKGELTAEVVSARPLEADQLDALAKKLRAGLGREVKLQPRVDAALLGGLVVKVGSRLIDSSLKSKLDSLTLAMKG